MGRTGARARKSRASSTYSQPQQTSITDLWPPSSPGDSGRHFTRSSASRSLTRTPRASLQPCSATRRITPPVSPSVPQAPLGSPAPASPPAPRAGSEGDPAPSSLPQLPAPGAPLTAAAVFSPHCGSAPLPSPTLRPGSEEDRASSPPLPASSSSPRVAATALVSQQIAALHSLTQPCSPLSTPSHSPATAALTDRELMPASKGYPSGSLSSQHRCSPPQAPQHPALLTAPLNPGAPSYEPAGVPSPPLQPATATTMGEDKAPPPPQPPGGPLSMAPALKDAMQHGLPPSQGARQISDSWARDTPAIFRISPTEESLQSTTNGQCIPPNPSWNAHLANLPTKDDFQLLLREVKDICRTEISAVRSDIQHITKRVESLEDDHDATRSYISTLQDSVANQAVFLRDMHNHLEDLDNRGRRNNIRIRGLPETQGEENLHKILESIFNRLLQAPPSHRIRMDRAHRALKPKGSSTAPRDVICRVADYITKEDIMSAARKTRSITHEGAQVQLFSDLSWVTLQKRRHLKPLLDVLRDHQILYRWNFPFALTARKDGRSATLRSIDDLQDFCSHLDIPVPHLMDWELAPPLACSTPNMAASTIQAIKTGLGRFAAFRDSARRTKTPAPRLDLDPGEPRETYCTPAK